MPLAGKHVLLLSPQPWGISRLSKHHYAVEVAKRGARVSFVSPSLALKPGMFAIKPVVEHPGLELLEYRHPFPSLIKFKAPRLFELLARWEAPRVLRALGVRSVDLVWDFGSSPLFPDLRAFAAKGYLFHPVDMVASSQTRGADLVVSLTDDILRKFEGAAVPTRFVNHGLGDAFAAQARCLLEALGSEPGARTSGLWNVGYAGNLLLPYIDHANYRSIIPRNREVMFHFWGPHDSGSSNLGGGAQRAIEFVNFLRVQPNVKLYGPTPQTELARALANMDALLICYDGLSDPNGAANSHKILEYLSTGRPIISSHISTYVRYPGMLEMLPNQDNGPFPSHFAEALGRLPLIDSPARRRERIEFALTQTYSRQLDRIEQSLLELGLLA